MSGCPDIGIGGGDPVGSWLMLEADRMPGRFELGGVQNPVGIFRFLGEPGIWRKAVTGVALKIDGGTGLKPGSNIVAACAVNDCVHVHMAGDMGDQIVAAATE